MPGVSLANNQIDQIDLTNVNQDVNIYGNLNVSGTMTTINSTDLIVYDKTILLNAHNTGNNTSGGAGFQIRDNNNDTQGYIQLSTSGNNYNIKATQNNYTLSTPVLSNNDTIATLTNLNSYVNKSGDSMTGNLNISGAIIPTSYQNLPTSSTSQAGIVQLLDSYTSTSTTNAPTCNALTNVNNLISNKMSKSGDTVTGNYIFNTGSNLFINQPQTYLGFNCDIAGWTRFKNGTTNPSLICYFESNTGQNYRYYIKVDDSTGNFVIGKNNAVLQINDVTTGTTTVAYNCSSFAVNNTTGTNWLTVNSSGVVVNGSLSASTLSGTLSTASQPNVTSVGNLTGLTVTGGCSLNYYSTGRYLEINNTTNTQYIDFHSLDSGNNDYDARIVSYGGTSGTIGQGSFNILANNISLTANGNATSLSSTGVLTVPNKISSPMFNVNQVMTNVNLSWSGSAGNTNSSTFSYGGGTLHVTWTGQLYSGTSANNFTIVFGLYNSSNTLLTSVNYGSSFSSSGVQIPFANNFVFSKVAAGTAYYVKMSCSNTSVYCNQSNNNLVVIEYPF